MPVVFGVGFSPPTRSVIMTAKMVGLDFTMKPVKVFESENMTEQYLKISPAHTIPAFEDDDGFRIFDSHSIVTYIVDKYAKDDSLYPKDLKKRSTVDSMLHFDNGSLWSSVLAHFVSQFIFGRPFDQELETYFKDKVDSLNTILGGRPYAAGDHLTVADICIANTMNTPIAVGFDFTDYPHVIKWFDKVKREIKDYDEVINESLVELKPALEKFKSRIAAKKAT